ncbi:MAG: DUF4331 family protein [Phycisphaerales bacterium]
MTTHRSFAAILAASLAAFAGAPVSLAADHREAPLIAEDPTADLNDIYVFPNPNDATRLCIMLTVNPFIKREQNAGSNFSENVRYRFEIDHNNDGRPERTISFTFLRLVTGGVPTMKVDFPGTQFDFDATVTQPSLAPTAPAPTVTTFNTIQAFAGQRDDPFFFNNVGFARFRAGVANPFGNAVDGFAGVNTSAIILEAPIATITGGPRTFQCWGATDRRRTVVRRSAAGRLEKGSGPWEQIERTGNPAVATAFVARPNRDRFNIIRPNRDAQDFGAEISATLTALGTNPANQAILASVAIPDTLKVNLDNAPGFPNGRRPQDDVIDGLFFFIFNQPTTPVTDNVPANDKAFLAAFPYLAEPFQPVGAP